MSFSALFHKYFSGLYYIVPGILFTRMVLTVVGQAFLVKLFLTLILAFFGLFPGNAVHPHAFIPIPFSIVKFD